MTSLTFNGVSYSYGWWAGQRLRTSADAPAGLDCETALIRELPCGSTDPRDVPALSLAMVYDGTSLLLIYPTDLGKFLGVNRGSYYVGHNIQYDFWVMQRYLEQAGDRVAQRLLWDAGEHSRLADTQVLDLLVQLGTGKYRRAGNKEDEKVYPTNLGVLAAEYEVGEVDKEDPYRLRYGELIGMSREQIESHAEFTGFAEYALKDVIAAREVYRKQRQQAIGIMRSVGWDGKPRKTYEIRPDALSKWGALTEYIQVRASISFAEMSRTPLRIDGERRQQMESALRQQYEADLKYLEQDCPGLWVRHKAPKPLAPKSKASEATRRRKAEQAALAGSFVLTDKSGVPKMNSAVLKAKLLAEAERLETPPPQNEGKTGGISTSAKAWAKYGDRSEWLKVWVRLEQQARLLQFVTSLAAGEVYTNYNLLMRTGRSSAGAHKRKGKLLLPSVNVQQMPKAEGFRELFVAPDGTLRYPCDYSYLELRTLAACCYAKFGYSSLGEAVRQHTQHGGPDPHQRVAASIMQRPIAEYLQLPKDVQKVARQQAKPVSFGFPGGLGIEKFVLFASASYGVQFTRDQAKEAKAAWIATYPEMEKWLADEAAEALAWSVGVAPSRLRLPTLKLWQLGKLLRGTDLSEAEADLAWEAVWEAASAGNNPELRRAALRRELTPEVKRLGLYRACTPTGRVRNRTKYTDSHNTPFQGLAADGGKEAVWGLYYAGYKPCMFVHDEVVVDLPAGKAQQERRRVDEIMNRRMESVLGGVPSAVEGHLAPYWKKG